MPMYFLIGVWGGPRKEYAAIKFFLYTLFGSIFMLVSILILYFYTEPHTLNILEHIQRGSMLALYAADDLLHLLLYRLRDQSPGLAVPHLVA